MLSKIYIELSQITPILFSLNITVSFLRVVYIALLY